MGGVPKEARTEAAAERFARLRSGEMEAAERADLKDWLADPESRAAFDDVAGLWSSLDVIRADPTLLSLREDARRQAKWVRLRRYSRGLAAACVVLAAVGAVSLSGWIANRSPPPATPEASVLEYASGLGQIKTVDLPDGSVVVLDTNSAIRFSRTDGGRSAELTQGRALFKVAKDPARPFVVAANGKAVTALGTEFDVYLKSNTLEVTLFEGRVRVEQTAAAADGAPAIELTPGYRLTASSKGWDLAQVGVDPAWPKGQLIFDEARLADIVAELNRYSDRKIAITDSAVGEKRMSAVLRSSDERTFLSAVQVMKLAEIRWNESRWELSAN